VERFFFCGGKYLSHLKVKPVQALPFLRCSPIGFRACREVKYRLKTRVSFLRFLKMVGALARIEAPFLRYRRGFRFLKIFLLPAGHGAPSSSGVGGFSPLHETLRPLLYCLECVCSLFGPTSDELLLRVFLFPLAPPFGELY